MIVLQAANVFSQLTSNGCDTLTLYNGSQLNVRITELNEKAIKFVDCCENNSNCDSNKVRIIWMKDVYAVNSDTTVSALIVDEPVPCDSVLTESDKREADRLKKSANAFYIAGFATLGASGGIAYKFISDGLGDPVLLGLGNIIYLTMGIGTATAGTTGAIIFWTAGGIKKGKWKKLMGRKCK